MGVPILSTTLLFSSSSSTTTLAAITALLLLSFTLFIIELGFPLKSHKRKGKRLPLPPGPAPWLIIGHVPQLLKNKPTFRWLHHILKEMNSEIACVRFGKVHVIMVTCPEIGLEFLKKQDALFAARPHTMATHLFSYGYLATAFPLFGDQWKKMRRVLTSEIISSARLQWLQDKRMEQAEHLVKYMYNRCMSGNVNLRTVTRHFAANLIKRMTFNKRSLGGETKDGGPGIEDQEHVEAIFKALSLFYSFCISDYFPFLTGLDLDGQQKGVKEAFRIVNKYQDPIVYERIKQWRDANPNSDNAHQKKEPEDLLDILITLKDGGDKPLLSVDEIRAQVTELMYTAMDNPSNAVEWAMAEMINQPELLQKAIEELDRVVGKERLVQESDIPRLNFVKACAREAFRLHPIASFNLPHVATSNTTVAGYFIPKGSHVLLSRIGLGRNPKVWDEPLKFKPERHLTSECPEVVLTEPNLRFISFSTGRRGCVAATLGSTMTTMLLARLLQGFTWTPPPNVSRVDLTENLSDLFLAKPLVAHAKPRLPLHLYPSE